MLESIQPYIGVLGCVLAVILLVYCIILHIRLGSLTKKFNFFMQGENGASLERKLSVEITEIREAAKGLQDMIEEQTQIRNIQGNTLLDGNNNGVCISSIYGRNDSRIFSKPIVKGKSLVNLSQEELESLNEALGERTNEEALASVIHSQ